MSMKMRKWGIILGMTLLLCTAFPFLRYLQAISENNLYFSASQHFYDKDIQLKLCGKPGGEIYYTTNGEIPSRESLPYTQPIQIRLPEEGVHVVTIRAIAFYKNGTSSLENIHTYFVGKDVFERYDSLITVITTAPSNLYDYDTGIFVEGRLRDEWIKENPGSSIRYSRPANYNLRGIESERYAYLEIFEPDGRAVIAQNVGIRVHGAGSRASEKKSIKLFARSEYGEKTFNYEFFTDCPIYQDDKFNYTYKRLILRNNISIENASILKMLEDTALTDIQECRFCCGYLNGSYYHAGWMMEDFDKNYFHSNYGTLEGDGYWGVIADYNEKMLDGKEHDMDSFTSEDMQPFLDKEYYDLFQKKDFQDDFIYNEFCKIVDVENMLRYFAIEIYMGNLDWPYNNIKMYRWYSYENNYTENSPTDGKWRYLLYDLDFGFTSGYDVNLLGHVLDRENEVGRHHIIFTNLMQREDIKARFKEIMMELSETVFEPERACQIISDTYAVSYAELSASLTEENADTEVIKEQLSNLENTKNAMLEFAIKRPEEIKRQMEELL